MLAWGLTSDNLYMLNSRPTDIHDVSSGGGQGARLQPKHFVHAMMLFLAFNCLCPPNMMEGYLQQRNLRDETQWSCERRIQNKSFGPIDLILSCDEDIHDPSRESRRTELRASTRSFLAISLSKCTSKGESLCNEVPWSPDAIEYTYTRLESKWWMVTIMPHRNCWHQFPEINRVRGFITDIVQHQGQSLLNHKYARCCECGTCTLMLDVWF